MTIFFCGETVGFYPDAPYGDAVGKACVELSDNQYQALMREIEQGKAISVVDGWPVAVDRVISFEQLVAFERSWRDAELSSSEWLVNRHRDEQDMPLSTTLAAEQFAELLIYRQSLRDWPQSELFPDAEQRPVAPPWIAEQIQ